MKKPELSITKNSRFSISQIGKMDTITEKYNFENISELIRESVTFFIQYLEHKEKYKDPEKMRKFAEEFDPLIKAEKKQDKLKILVGNYTDEDLEQFYFIFSHERNVRIKDKITSAKNKKFVLTHGGELVPRVGYVLGTINDVDYYRPITPNCEEWDDLSTEDKEALLLELKQKLSELNSIPLNPRDNQISDRYLQLRHIVKEITGKISEEKEV